MSEPRPELHRGHTFYVIRSGWIMASYSGWIDYKARGSGWVRWLTSSTRITRASEMSLRRGNIISIYNRNNQTFFFFNLPFAVLLIWRNWISRYTSITEKKYPEALATTVPEQKWIPLTWMYLILCLQFTWWRVCKYLDFKLRNRFSTNFNFLTREVILIRQTVLYSTYTHGQRKGIDKILHSRRTP